MDINDAVSTVEKFFDEYNQNHDDWNPIEIRVLPSGDDNDVIKIWFNFGPDVAEAELAGLKDRPMAELEKNHPNIADDFTLKVRADAM